MKSPLWMIQAWLGQNPGLPYIDEVTDPKHGDVAKNTRRQKVIYDEKQGGKWVMPQNFSDREPVTVTPNKKG